MRHQTLAISHDRVSIAGYMLSSLSFWLVLGFLVARFVLLGSADDFTDREDQEYRSPWLTRLMSAFAFIRVVSTSMKPLRYLQP